MKHVAIDMLTEDRLCADGSVDGERFEVLTKYGGSLPEKDRIDGARLIQRIEARFGRKGRSNRLRRMDAKGLKEWIGMPMPMDGTVSIGSVRWKTERVNEKKKTP